MKQARTGRHAANYQPMRMCDVGPFANCLPQLAKLSAALARSINDMRLALLRMAEAARPIMRAFDEGYNRARR